MANFLTASGVPLIDELRGPVRDINKKGQGRLQDLLGGISANQTASSRASGRVQGTYAPQTLQTAGKQASSGIENTLLGQLGTSSLNEIKSQQEYERQMQLAKKIGDLNKPSLLQEILGGLGLAGKTAPQFKSIYDSLNSRPKLNNNPTYGTGANPYGGNLDSVRGYRPYDYESNWR